MSIIRVIHIANMSININHIAAIESVEGSPGNIRAKVHLDNGLIVETKWTATDIIRMIDHVIKVTQSTHHA